MPCHQHCQENVRLVNKCQHYDLQLLNPKVDLAEHTRYLADVLITPHTLHQPFALRTHRDFLSNPPPLLTTFLNVPVLRI